MAETAVLTLDDEEVSRRVSILRRFRELLKAQADRFRQYLEVLDRQKDVIEEGNAEDAAAYVEFEEKIIADIFSIQKVIDPLEAMYRAAYPLSGKGRKRRAKQASAEDAAGIPDLKTVLEGLKSEAASRVERNKELLSRRMAAIQTEITAIRKNPYSRKSRSVYGEVPSPSLLDIEG